MANNEALTEEPIWYPNFWLIFNKDGTINNATKSQYAVIYFTARTGTTFKGYYVS
jgi:hypothetical protein